jgi:hypothetical protein
MNVVFSKNEKIVSSKAAAVGPSTSSSLNIKALALGGIGGLSRN